MIEQAPKIPLNHAVYRFGHNPAVEDTLKKMGITDPQDIEEILSAAKGQLPTGDPLALLDLPFQQLRRLKPTDPVFKVGRFSNGTWPVFYGAVDPETAEAETAHRIPTYTSGSSAGHWTFYYNLFQASVVGQGRDLSAMANDWPKLIDPDDYSFCWSIASEAIRDGLEGLLVPSARRNGGTNLPVFERHALSAAVIRQLVAFHFDAASGSVTAKYHDPSEN